MPSRPHTEFCSPPENWKFTNPSGADIVGNNGSAVYTVTVTGNGHTLEFSATLVD
jgi:hypothetical protein